MSEISNWLCDIRPLTSKNSQSQIVFNPEQEVTQVLTTGVQTSPLSMLTKVLRAIVSGCDSSSS